MADRLPTGIDQLPSGLYRARYRDSDGKQHGDSFVRLGDARRWRTAQTASVDAGKHVSAAAGRVTFREYAEEWREAQVHRPSSAAHVETMLRRHAYPFLGHRQLAAIRPTEVQAWVRRLGERSPDRKPLAPATVQVMHGIVAGIFRAAMRDRCVGSNPCGGTRLPKREPVRVAPLDLVTVQAIRDALPSRWQATADLAAGTGMRIGEVLGLTVDRVDFLRRVLTVDRQLVSVESLPTYIGPPKTTASHRVIPLPQTTVDALAAHLAKHGTATVDLPLGAPDRAGSPVALIFGSARGGPVGRSTFAHTWRVAVRVAGAPTGTGFHALRHFYASLLIRHGESVKTVQARLGHASASETLDTYSHLWPDSDDRTREAIDAVLGDTERVTSESR